ncbi:hypothetical protein [Magnetofaba australis]|uniref:hypothetical protein n=1 Tax=Magnetofaba australis TaxID=1472297 RepID=UPI001180C128|nr:hypothetical protein [Magnetofaba australis]
MDSPLWVGLAAMSDGLSVAAVDLSVEPARVDLCDFHPYGQDGRLTADALAALRDPRLRKRPAVAVLSSGSYQLFPFESPKGVPDQELRNAVALLAQDRLESDPLTTVVDVFDMPDGHAGGDMVFVAAAPQERILPLIDLAEEATVKLDRIDIEDLALANLTRNLPEIENGVALLRLGLRDGLLMVVVGDALYLSRPIPSGLADIAESVGGLETLNSAAEADEAYRKALLGEEPPAHEPTAQPESEQPGEESQEEPLEAITDADSLESWSWGDTPALETPDFFDSGWDLGEEAEQEDASLALAPQDEPPPEPWTPEVERLLRDSSALDEICREAQRTLDYYESYFRRQGVASLYILPPCMEIPGLREAVSDRLSARIKWYAPEVWLNLANGEAISTRALARGLPAIGAALGAR